MVHTLKLSVIIPYFRAAETIEGQLAALARQRWSAPWEVIISDNESSESLVRITRPFRDRLPQLSIVDSADRRGAGHARNVGAEAARGELIAFCDADDEVGVGWLEAIGNALSQNEMVASHFDFSKLNPPWVAIAYGSAQSKGLQNTWYPPYLPHAGGSGLGLKHSLHESVGGFDESLPALEDKDYCLRVQLSGVKLHFVADAIVHVRSPTGLRELFNQSRLWASYNVLLSKRYRTTAAGIPHPWTDYGMEWARVLRGLPRLGSRMSRVQWVREFGWQVGITEGSVKHRVPPV